MSYIVWDNGEPRSFRTAKAAWGYIMPVLRENPVLKFMGFRDTKVNAINNKVGILRDFDTIKPWVNAPPYMQPGDSK